MNDSLLEEVRRVLDEQARLSQSAEQLDVNSNLYDAGMTSHASVNVMLALEDAFDVEFPDQMLTRNAFETIGAIAANVDQLRQEAA